MNGSGASPSAHPHLEEKLFDAGPVFLNYAEGPAHGEAPVLLHGLARSWQDFLALIPNLSHRWHIFAVDLRGHGKSGHVPRGYESGCYAADVAKLLHEVVARPAVILGHSMGGVAAMYLAAESPALAGSYLG